MHLHFDEKICNMNGVREYVEKDTVELHCKNDTDRYTIVAFNEGGNNSVEIDLEDLISWIDNNKKIVYDGDDPDEPSIKFEMQEGD